MKNINNKTFVGTLGEGDEDGKDRVKFKLDLGKMPVKYDPYTQNWYITRVKAFQNALRGYILYRIPDAIVTYTDIKLKDKTFDLRVTVESVSLGKLSTEFPIGMIIHPKCPHNLPQLIANEFKKELNN